MAEIPEFHFIMSEDEARSTPSRDGETRIASGEEDGDEPQARKRGRTFERDADRRARERAEAEQAR